MLSIEAIDELSPHLEAVKQLWRLHSDTLGFMPAGAFADYAADRHILVALNDGQCVGYLLYRTVRDRVTIAHFCVAQDARQQGVAKAMLNLLIESTRRYRGIVLSCRRDFEASKAWPRLGFHASGEIDGRALGGSKLVRWMLDYGHADLFSNADEGGLLEIAIDSNVFLDLADSRNDETDGLSADWLRPHIALCYTPELLNEIDRNDDEDTRKKRHAEIQQYQMLGCTPDAFQKAELTLKPLFPSLSSPQDESDYRHLVRAVAAEADAFVTRDRRLLDRAEDIFQVCGLSVVRPAELIGRIDVIERERDYQRNFVAGTRRIIQNRISCVDSDLIAAIQLPDEQQRALEATLNRYLANPQKYQCHKMIDSDGTNLALFVVEREAGADFIPILRVCAKRQAGTISRAVLTGLIRQAVVAGRKGVFIKELNLSEALQAACSDLGFLPVAGGRLKIALSGWIPIDDAAKLITCTDPRIDELRAALPVARSDSIVASRLEHLIWPGKLADADLPCFIIPIWPQFAEHLFDERLASGSLFGADVDLALNPESAYYRAAKPGIVTCPSRVLWYVSKNDNYPGTMAIRACSRIVELAIGKPKQLYSRFRRLGVYEWRDVLAKADGDLNKELMAFRFDDSELLQPIPWDTFQGILKENGINTNLESPVAIPATVFGNIYAAAFNSSQVC